MFVFLKNPEMCFILKERICPLLIKLFSPSTKLKLGPGASPSSSAADKSASGAAAVATAASSASFPIVSRLIRIVYVLIKSYFELLITESEIFLSLLAKLLDMQATGAGGAERPVWQKALVIECLHKIALEPRLVQLICVHYDMQPHPEKIFHLMCSGIALFIQSLFLSAAMSGAGGGAGGGAAGAGGGGQGAGAGAAGAAAAQSAGSGSAQAAGSGSSQQQQQQSSFAFQVSTFDPLFMYFGLLIIAN